jgi:hypothetical protein
VDPFAVTVVVERRNPGSAGRARHRRSTNVPRTHHHRLRFHHLRPQLHRYPRQHQQQLAFALIQPDKDVTGLRPQGRSPSFLPHGFFLSIPADNLHWLLLLPFWLSFPQGICFCSCSCLSGCHSRRESAVALAFLVVIPAGNPLLLLLVPFWLSFPQGICFCSCSCLSGCHSRRESASALARAFPVVIPAGNLLLLLLLLFLLSFPKGICFCSCSCLSGCHSRRESASALARAFPVVIPAGNPLLLLLLPFWLSFPQGICFCTCSCLSGCHSRRESASALALASLVVIPAGNLLLHLLLPFWLSFPQGICFCTCSWSISPTGVVLTFFRAKARFIPAWAEGLGNRQKRIQRAEGPIHKRSQRPLHLKEKCSRETLIKSSTRRVTASQAAEKLILRNSFYLSLKG